MINTVKFTVADEGDKKKVEVEYSMDSNLREMLEGLYSAQMTLLRKIRAYNVDPELLPSMTIQDLALIEKINTKNPDNKELIILPSVPKPSLMEIALYKEPSLIILNPFQK